MAGVDGAVVSGAAGRADSSLERPLSPTVAAYLFSYAEFILPICLIIGFATRFASLGFLVMTALVSIYVMPDALWTTHVYWVSILMVLLSVGTGAVSIDALIRYVYEKQ